jgi:hypothetical protein
MMGLLQITNEWAKKPRYVSGSWSLAAARPSDAAPKRGKRNADQGDRSRLGTVMLVPKAANVACHTPTRTRTGIAGSVGLRAGARANVSRATVGSKPGAVTEPIARKPDVADESSDVHVGIADDRGVNGVRYGANVHV